MLVDILACYYLKITRPPEDGSRALNCPHGLQTLGTCVNSVTACVVFNMEKLPRLGVLHWLERTYQLCLRVEIQTTACRQKFETKRNYMDQSTKTHLSCVPRTGNQCLATSYSFPLKRTHFSQLTVHLDNCHAEGSENSRDPTSTIEIFLMPFPWAWEGPCPVFTSYFLLLHSQLETIL